MDKSRCRVIDAALRQRLTLKREPTHVGVCPRARGNCIPSGYGQVRNTRDLTMRKHMPRGRSQYSRRELERSSLAGPLGWRLGSLLLALSPLGVALGACAE